MDRHIIPDRFIISAAGRLGGRWWILQATWLERPWGGSFFLCFFVGNHGGTVLPSELASAHIYSLPVAKPLSITGSCLEATPR